MSFAYQPFYTGDYYRDTRHLSMLQHGAYRQLLDHCWDQKGPLPLDPEKCYRICGAVSKEEQDAVRSVIAEFFVRMDDGHYNRRMQREIERCDSISALRSELGKRGGLAKAKQLPSKRQAKDKQVLSNCLSPSPSPSLDSDSTPEQRDKQPTVVPQVAVATLGRRQPCPTEKIVSLYHEALPMCPRCEILTATRKAHISARWGQVMTENDWTPAQALEWFAKFFTQMSRSRFLTGRVNGRDGKPPFRATLDFLMRPESFAKAVEGVYRDKEAA